MSTRPNTISRLQALVSDRRHIRYAPLQRRWEQRWLSASSAWLVTLSTMLLGEITWRTAIMITATVFMIARGGDMLDNSQN